MARSSSSGNRLFDRQRALEAVHPKARPLNVHLTPPHLDGLRHAQTVAVNHQKQGVVADTAAAFFWAASSNRSISGLRVSFLEYSMTPTNDH